MHGGGIRATTIDQNYYHTPIIHSACDPGTAMHLKARYYYRCAVVRPCDIDRRIQLYYKCLCIY